MHGGGEVIAPSDIESEHYQEDDGKACAARPLGHLLPALLIAVLEPHQPNHHPGDGSEDVRPHAHCLVVWVGQHVANIKRGKGNDSKEPEEAKELAVVGVGRLAVPPAADEECAALLPVHDYVWDAGGDDAVDAAAGPDEGVPVHRVVAQGGRHHLGQGESGAIKDPVSHSLQPVTCDSPPVCRWAPPGTTCGRTRGGGRPAAAAPGLSPCATRSGAPGSMTGTARPHAAFS